MNVDVDILASVLDRKSDAIRCPWIPDVELRVNVAPWPLVQVRLTAVVVAADGWTRSSPSGRAEVVSGP